jgi:integrase
MPRKLPLHVDRNTVKGKVYLSFRIGHGPRIKLPSDPNSEQFAEAYREALAGNYRPTKSVKTVAAGSIAALVRSYMSSLDYLKLRETTRAGYASRLREIEEKHGHRLVAGLTPERVEKAFIIPNLDKPGKAHSLLKMLRILVKHAIKRRMLRHDPTVSIARPKLGEIRSWTDAELEQFEERWPIGTKQRTAFALLLYFGQRRSDVHRMTWSDITPDGIRVKQQKTGADLTIPVHRDLARVLAGAERDHLVILATAYGRPFTVDGFSGFMRDAIREAGLPLDCKPHGLRKAAGRRLAEAGNGANRIMSVLGHKTLAEAERYTRDADQRRLAADAIRTLEGERAEDANAQTNPAPFGEVPKKNGNSI